MSADDHKQRGNSKFSQGDYRGAIEEYSIAIIKNPSNPIFFTNRSLCYLKLEDWELALRDAERAIELDSAILKGYYYQGQAMIGKGSKKWVSKGLEVLERIYSLSRANPTAITKDIPMHILQARRKLSILVRQEERREKDDFYNYLSSLIHRDDGLDEDQKQTKLSNLDGLFESKESTNNLDIPDAFLDKISFHIMTDPVITPSGVTFNRTEVQEHLAKIGPFDPFTRQPMTVDDLIPNLALKETIELFLANHGWATNPTDL